MLTAIVIVAIVSIQLVSIQLVSVHSGPVEKCLGDTLFHKKFPSPEGPGFATCFPWKNKSCCSAETTVELKKNGVKNLYHFDWDYCGGLSEPCKKYLINNECFYFCDPNLIKWQAYGRYMSGVPICSDTCDKWFEACKNDKTYSEDWLADYALCHSEQGPIKPNRPCRTFAEIFQNGEGMCNKIYGPVYKYERSSNCMVLNFKGENPNDKVVPVPSSSS